MDDALEQVTNATSKNAILRLKELYKSIEQFGLSEFVFFDLAMLSKYNYYTGMIFKGYASGNGEPIVKGGRYDNLLGQFGKDAPAVGFVVVIDDLLNAMWLIVRLTGSWGSLLQMLLL